MEQDEGTCFKCKFAFPSPRALEIHLRDCDAEWDPKQPTPWTFIPPPDRYDGPTYRGRGRGHGRGDYNGGRGGMNRGRGGGGGGGRGSRGDFGSGFAQQRGGFRGRARGGRRSSFGDDGQMRPSLEAKTSPSEPLGIKTNMSGSTGPNCSKCRLSFKNPQELATHFNESPAHPNSGFAPSPTTPTDKSSSDGDPVLLPSRDWERNINIKIGKPAQCTKCNLSFDTPQELATHFYLSPAHPYSVPPVGNRWTAPPFLIAPDQTEGHTTDEAPGELRHGGVVPVFRGIYNKQVAEDMIAVGMSKLGLE